MTDSDIELFADVIEDKKKTKDDIIRTAQINFLKDFGHSLEKDTESLRKKQRDCLFKSKRLFEDEEEDKEENKDEKTLGIFRTVKTPFSFLSSISNSDIEGIITEINDNEAKICSTGLNTIVPQDPKSVSTQRRTLKFCSI